MIETSERVIPKAIATGSLHSKGLPTECYVLDNGQRVLSGRQALRALADGPKKLEKSSGAKDGRFGRLLRSLPADSGGFRVEPSLVEFWTFGGLGKGLCADDFVRILRAFSKAFLEGSLHHKQIHIGRHATAYLHALASTGLTALIDEATGYQSVRHDGALARHLERVLRLEAREWECTFPKSLVLVLSRLHERPWSGRGSYPRFLAEDFGFIYELAVGAAVTGELRRRNPLPEFGHNHHQFLQEDSRRILQRDLDIAEALAGQSKTPREWRQRMGVHFRKEPLDTVSEVDAVRRGAR